MEMASAFTLNMRLDNIAIITIDVPGEKMNTLKVEFASQVRVIIKQLRENKDLRGVVFISAKPDDPASPAPQRLPVKWNAERRHPPAPALTPVLPEAACR